MTNPGGTFVILSPIFLSVVVLFSIIVFQYFKPKSMKSFSMGQNLVLSVFLSDLIERKKKNESLIKQCS